MVNIEIILFKIYPFCVDGYEWLTKDTNVITSYFTDLFANITIYR